MDDKREQLVETAEPKRTSFVKFMIALDRVLYAIESNIAMICFVVMGLAVLYGIVMRFVFRAVNQYGEEVSRYMLVFAAYMGVSINVRVKGHLSVDLFVDRLPIKAQKVVRIFTGIVQILTYALLVVLSIQFIKMQMSVGQVSSAMRLPMYVVYMTFLLGFSVSTLRSIMLFWNDNFAKEKVLTIQGVSVLEGGGE